MAPVQVLENLGPATLESFRRNKRKDILDYFPSEAYREQNELQTEIRICPSLGDKPGKDDDEEDEDDKKDQEEEKEEKPDDVFDSRYWGPLLVRRFDAGDESFGFLLNMNAVMPMHSIIITKHFQNQFGTLTESQLLALFTIMKSLAAGPVYEKDGKTRTGFSKNVGFYNCGQTSGCSQAHRHMQLLPLEGEDGLGDFPIERGARAYKKGESLPDETFSIPSLPYMHFVRRLSELDEKASNEADLSAYLKKVYSELLQVMQRSMRDHPDCKTTELDKEEGMHYNLLLTHEHMHVIPRREESYTIPPREGTIEKEGKPAATEPKELSVNSIGYMGTMLVENETDDRRLREVGGVLHVLEHCGFSKGKMPAKE